MLGKHPRFQTHRTIHRPSLAIREGDVLRVDFPANAMRWSILSVDSEIVRVESAQGHRTKIDREYLRHLMASGAVRRETPTELTEHPPILGKES